MDRDGTGENWDMRGGKIEEKEWEVRMANQAVAGMKSK